MTNAKEVFRPVAKIEFDLSVSDLYTEKLSINTIEAQPWLVEFVIRTQLLSAKNPDEWRVKSRTLIERARLPELHDAIGKFLQVRS
jgi:hypothetical protein